VGGTNPRLENRPLAVVDVEAALEVLLGALGVGREAVAFIEDDLDDERSGTLG
jgi:hypothetical protein